MSQKTLYNWLIYFILPALYGSDRSLWGPSWTSQSFMHHHILCDLFRGIHGVQEIQVSVMMTQNAALVHRLLSDVLKLGRHGHHSGEGDTAQPQPKHWPANDTVRNSHTVRVKCAGALSCILLKWHLLHNPIVAWLWYNIIPHLIHITPLTFPSKKYGPMI